MQPAIERTLVEAGRDATQAKVEGLARLPGFGAKSQRELMRMLVDHSVAVVPLQPRQAAFSAGDTVAQVRFCCGLTPNPSRRELPGTTDAQHRCLLPHAIGTMCLVSPQ